MKNKLITLCLTMLFIIACTLTPLPSTAAVTVSVDAYKRATLARAPERSQIATTEDYGTRVRRWNNP